MGHHLVLKSGNQMDAINMYPWLYTFYYHDVMYHWHVPENMLCNIFYYPYYVSFCKVEIPFSNYRWFVQSWRNLVGLSMVILCQKWGPVLLKWNRHEQDTWAIQDTLVDWLPKGLILPNLLGIMITQSFRETVFNQLVFHEMGKRGIFNGSPKSLSIWGSCCRKFLFQWWCFASVLVPEWSMNLLTGGSNLHLKSFGTEILSMDDQDPK